MDKFVLFEAGIYVHGEGHQPKLMTEDYLEKSGMVSKEWDWKVDDESSPPPEGFVGVRFRNGVRVALTVGHLNVTQTSRDQNGIGVEIPRIGDIALAYVKAEPGLGYETIEAEFSFLREAGNPAEIIGKAIFQPRVRQISVMDIGYAEADFGFLKDDAIVKAKISRVRLTKTGNVERGSLGTKLEGVMVQVNFTRDCQQPSDDDSASHQELEHIGQFTHDLRWSDEYVSALFST